MDKTEIFLNQGDSFLEISEFDKAESLYKSAIKEDSEDYRGWYGLFKVYTKNFTEYDNPKDYISVMAKAIKLAPPECAEEVKANYKTYLEKKREHIHNLEENQKLIEKRKKEKLKKISVTFAILVVVSILVMVLSIIVRNQRYDKVIGKIQNISSLNDFNEVGRDLDSLSSNYEDVEKIKTEFSEIEDEFVFLMENINPNGWKDYEIDDLRDTYWFLMEFDEEYENWNLSAALGLVSKLLFIIENKLYVYGDNSQYIHLYIYGSGKRLENTLPTAKDENKSYYFTTRVEGEYVIIGFENQNDSADAFDAFRITVEYDGLSPFECYIYSTGETVYLL